MARSRRRFRHCAGTATELEPIIQRWVLRLLVTLGGQREFLHQYGFNNEPLAMAIGLGHWIESGQTDALGVPRSPDCNGRSRPGEVEFDLSIVRFELRKLHQQAEQRWKNALLPDCLRRNIDKLSSLVGLDTTDGRILEFAVAIHNERLLDDAADWLGQLTSAKVYRTLSAMLDLPEPDVRKALSTQGILARSGLVSVDHSGPNTLRGKLNLLSDDFADLMSSSDADPIGLLRGTVSALDSGHLALSDFSHIQPSLDVLLPYLRNASATGRRGVNIFLHGAPGTGKSQLARTLAGDLGCELFDVASEGADGDPINGERRLQAFRAAQSFFAKQHALVVFDEVEDVFNDGNGFFGRKSTAQVRKAWINRMLEENPVPTLWLSNTIIGLDPAFIRRFDMVFELPIPPKRQRERILQDICGDLLDTQQISRIADVGTLAPAVVAKASAVVHAIRDQLGTGKTAAAFERLISNTLEAQGHRPLLTNDPNSLPEFYDPGFIHADADLADVAQGLVSARAGRLCLYGPPGTGKTAYGRWVAEQLGAPLLVKRASELLSPFVGENEMNIARAFLEAKTEHAVLLMDEVDSFLRDRRGASQGWQVSQVNEMLTQMESFPGVFIVSTNLMDGLDQAALRRFDLKVKFDYLRPDQVKALFCRYCATLGLPLPTAEEQSRLARLDQLTPGDFATVLRQHRFRPIQNAAALASALESECMMKESTKRSIGFL